ncbi:N-acetyltransferase [Streptomyces nigrescens]|uniref:N-acetyltransferase n=2 Tax=Streptomyces TaxID=1883 RepID=A0ABN6QNV6_STRNI|nr:GNAT family N-acetyltransferase [Streptomyces nigrescens]MEE4421862.1 GNAT family N-acetyltransferase [Streptomyces sp. DSM 41528]BDM67660.1 N-acetyltransferase [Streptomyces nigrescens]
MSDAAILRTPWTIATEPVDSPDARALLREYYTEVADRYFTLHEDRLSTPREIDEGVAEYPVADLAPPHGVLLVARRGGETAGCAGVRLLDARTAELKQMFVRPAARGLGGGGGLLMAAEAAAARLGAERIRLDTRRDLTEAIALYRRHGFVEIAPYHDDIYAEIFFEKRLGGGDDGDDHDGDGAPSAGRST